jgi:hypothetical protein
MRPLFVFLLALVSNASTSAMSDVQACPVTTRPNPSFTPPAPYPAAVTDKAFRYGTEHLWTLPRVDGPLGQREKLFWWRPGFDGRIERRPNLTIALTRLNSQVGILSNRPATNAFFNGTWSILTLVDFPEPGCWRVTGTYEGRALTFVTAVGTPER